MNKKFFLTSLAVFFVWMMGGFFIHGGILHDDYGALKNLFRSDEESQKYFHWMVLSHVFLAGSFVWIYARGVEAKPWLPQGLCFGIAVMLLTIVPTYLIYYTVQPMPGQVVAKQILLDGGLILILGVGVAFVYRKHPV